MGDTLVYNNTASGLNIPPDKPFKSAETHSYIPTSIAATATTTLFATSMLASQHTQNAPPRERRPTEIGSALHGGFTLKPTLSNDSHTQALSIILRKLPRNTGIEGVHTLLLFAKDLVHVRLIDSTTEDAAFATALAKFGSYSSAKEVKDSLDGKMNATNDAKLIVEMPTSTSPADNHAQLGPRRSTIDGTGFKSGASSSASDQSSRQSSRYSSTFQSSEKVPSLVTNSNVNDQTILEGQPFPSMFNTSQSPSNQSARPQHNFGKSVINDNVDDETDGIIRDTMSWMRGGRHQNKHRSFNHQLPTSQFAGMSLNGLDVQSPLSAPNSGLTSPGSGSAQHGGSHYFPSMNSQSQYGPASKMPGRTSYPAANPADQNPPCNTLYVGNLPNNTSEDELKRLFSQQRGYKRLCFRTKQNGPMCFVEFENVTLATQALHHLYGKMLSNSIKGGIRLSFSKNPLGVRSGPNGMPPNGISPYSNFNAFGNDIPPPPGFATSPAGPPPGLPAGGRAGPRPPMIDGINSTYQAHQYSMAGQPFASQLRMPNPIMYPNTSPSTNGHYQAY